MCILGPFRTLLKMGLIDLDLQGHLALKLLDFREFELVRTITCDRCELESPFLHSMYILEPFRTLLKMGTIDLDLHGQTALIMNDFW